MRLDYCILTGEGGRCGCRAEAGGCAGLLQGLGERRADRGGVTRQMVNRVSCAVKKGPGTCAGGNALEARFTKLRSAETALPPVSARGAIMEKTKHPFIGDSQVSIAMNSTERGRRGAVAQHDERRCKTMRATRFRRVALFAERPGGTGKKVKDREIDVAPWFCTGPCVSKGANHWQASAPRRARVARRASTRSG